MRECSTCTTIVQSNALPSIATTILRLRIVVWYDEDYCTGKSDLYEYFGGKEGESVWDIEMPLSELFGFFQKFFIVNKSVLL